MRFINYVYLKTEEPVFIPVLSFYLDHSIIQVNINLIITIEFINPVDKYGKNA